MSEDRISIELNVEERAFVVALLASAAPASVVPPDRLPDMSHLDDSEYWELWVSCDDKLRTADIDMRPHTAGGLLSESRLPLAEMRRHGIVRTANAPAGDTAEWLVLQATNGQLAPNSQKGWDVQTTEGERIQVKARFVSDPIKSSQRQLSAFRSFEFDSLIVVFFDDVTPVARASKLPRHLVEEGALADQYVNAQRVIASEDLMGAGENWTSKLQGVAEMHLDKFRS